MAGAAGVAPPALFIHDGGQNDWKATTAGQHRQAPSSITASQNCPTSHLYPFQCSRTIEAKNIAAIISHCYFSQHVKTFTCIVSKQWSCLCVVYHRWLVSCADFLVVVVCWVSTITPASSYHISFSNGNIVALTGIESHMVLACYKTLYYLMLISEGGLFQGTSPSEYCRDWRFCSQSHNVVREPCSLSRRLVEGWAWELRSDVNKYIYLTYYSVCIVVAGV